MNLDYRIFIVEDDTAIASSLQSALTTWGYEARCADDFTTVHTQFAAFSPHLVLLDIALPQKGGFYWCEEIRKLSNVPIIFLSSANDSMNIVTAMNLGADDFIAKPFDLHVLVSKIKAHLRRSYEFEHNSELLEYKGLILNLATFTAHHQAAQTSLTRNEFRILHTLMERRGRVVSREALMQALWEDDSYVDDNTLTVNMTRLRKKIEELGAHGYIQTKKGEGYVIA